MVRAQAVFGVKEDVGIDAGAAEAPNKSKASS
jgi:hypothetical protein